MAAVDGDVITLSSGNFNAVNIEKAITVRGAGMIGLENGTEPTILTGKMSITLVTNANNVFTMEGLACESRIEITGSDFTPVIINKCLFGDDLLIKNADAKLTHCYHWGRSTYSGCHFYAQGTNVRVNCLNCIILNPTTYYATNGQFVLENCIVLDDLSDLDYSTLRNCILVSRSGSGKSTLPSTATANNCVAYDTNYQAETTFDSTSGTNNKFVESMSVLFKSFNNLDPQRNETFELTETAAATYLGDDGKQVGIYGGTNPFDPTPTNPQITKFTVDRSVNSGKLSVKINVE